MLLLLVMMFLVVSSTLAEAQINYDIATGSFTCPPTAGTGSFCLAQSMVSSLIIHCNGENGTEEDCNHSLSGVPLVGNKLTAACYEESPSSGKAACSFEGIVYPEAGEPYPITTTATFSSTSPSTSPMSSMSSASSAAISTTSTPSTSSAYTTSVNSTPNPTSSGGSSSASMTISTATSDFVPWTGRIGMGTLTTTTSTTSTSTGGAGSLRRPGFQAGAIAWGMVGIVAVVA